MRYPLLSLALAACTSLAPDVSAGVRVRVGVGRGAGRTFSGGFGFPISRGFSFEGRFGFPFARGFGAYSFPYLSSYGYPFAGSYALSSYSLPVGYSYGYPFAGSYALSSYALPVGYSYGYAADYAAQSRLLLLLWLLSQGGYSGPAGYAAPGMPYAAAGYAAPPPASYAAPPAGASYGAEGYASGLPVLSAGEFSYLGGLSDVGVQSYLSTFYPRFAGRLFDTHFRGRGVRSGALRASGRITSRGAGARAEVRAPGVRVRVRVRR